jgi:uncharacterized lipoprotein YddW (UPF0748 family)
MTRWIAPLLLLAVTACATMPTTALTPPPVEREFRGIWVASVNNIDWPTRRGLPAEQQRQELIAILDRAVSIGANVIVLQVRPSADAFYESSLEPWSTHLTGQQGTPPNPRYDPLAFAIEEAHRRGLELHAWFNPYRARVASDTGPADPAHISVRRPDLVKQYGSFLWMDPGELEVLAHTRSVLLDVVRRYNVDGIHIDDYFYPYPERDSAGALIPFPDDVSWEKYLASGGTLSRSDWRRQNVDRLVAELYSSIRAEKPWVRFGVSPIGAWRPGYPEGTRGYDAYEQIYADARLWWRNGWLDYFAPQLYWRINAATVPFAQMLAWWADENERDRQLVIGLFTSRADTVDEGNRWRATEILEQIRITRAHPGTAGHIHFSERALAQNRDSIADKLRTLYNGPSLVPMPRDAPLTAPAPPTVSFTRDAATGAPAAVLGPGDTADVWLWTVRTRTGRDWQTAVVPGVEREYVLAAPGGRRPDEIIVTAVDRLSRESTPVRARVPRR